MTFRMALRSFAAQPVRSAVLVCGFGTGIACMAGLLGVGEVILEQSRSAHLRGGGDLVVYGTGGRVTSARFVTSQLLVTSPLEGRLVAAAPSLDSTVYLVRDGRKPLALSARGGIPTLERALADPETSKVAAWQDTDADRDWVSPEPGGVLRAMDRFHAIPDVPARAESWAEWLYFNGRSPGARFYLSFMVGPRGARATRRAGVRLQFERDGRKLDYVARAEIPEAELLRHAPDLDIGANRVRLHGLRYRIDLALYDERRGEPSGAPDVTGSITLEAVPGRSVPPLQIRGAGGWVSGYVVPVLSGALSGTLEIAGERITLEGRGYHDHNWGFWEGVTWQWGQVAGAELSVLYGRVRPPDDAADPERIPGFLVVMGPDGPLGFATDMSIDESGDADGPRRILVEGHGDRLELTLALDVRGTTRTRFGGSFGRRGEFVQMQADYRVTGTLAGRSVDFSAPGAAETFRGDDLGDPR